MSMKIAIIGGGGSAMCLISQFVPLFIERWQKEANPTTTQKSIELHIFEKGSKISRGLAYDSSMTESQRLHFFGSVTSVLASDPEAFAKWTASANKNIPITYNVRKMQEYEKNLPPRTLFGDYLEACLQSAHDQIHDFNALQERLKLICHTNSEVINILPTDTHQSVLEIANQGRFGSTFDYVVIATGHLPAHPSFLDKNIDRERILSSKNYLPSPWDSQRCKEIPSSASVAIIGSSLTGVDTVLGLVDRGHTGPIYLISRSGFIPRVLALDPPKNMPTIFTPQKLKQLAQETGQLKFEEVLTLFQEEIEKAQGSKVDWDALFRRARGMTAAELEREIEGIKSKPIAGWQEIMYSAYHVTNYDTYGFILDHLDVANKFFNDTEINYSSIFTYHLTCLPVNIAEKLLKLMQVGQLKIIGGYQSTAIRSDQKFEVRCKEETIYSEYLIHGSSVTPLLTQLTKNQSELWCNLRDSGSVQKVEPEYLGGLKGVKYDRKTFRIESATLKNCFLIGPMTFFLTDIVLFRSQAASIVKQLLAELFT